MRKVKTSLYPLGGILAMIAVALFITWTTATPDERDDIVIWATGQVGQEHRRARRAGDVRPTERYLYADVFGGSGYGAPYIDCDCSLDGPFAIVYGHYMSDGQRVLRDLGRVPPPGEYKPVSR